ncbi:hypothetical protein M514_10643, partial [Trichuris suis]
DFDPSGVSTERILTYRNFDFRDFDRHRLIRPTQGFLYHATNSGQAERTVQMKKDRLKKVMHGNWDKRLLRFLLASHIIPSTMTGPVSYEATTADGISVKKYTDLATSKS